MRNRGSIDAMAIAICVLAAGFAVGALWHFPPRQDSAVYRELGRSMAREAIAQSTGESRLIVLARNTATYKQPAMDIALKAFGDEAEKARRPVEIRFVDLDPLRPVEVPPGDFFETIRRAKTNDVIVSFMGPPVLELEQEAKLKAKPKIVALCTGSLSAHADLTGLGRRGLLSAAIVNRAVAGSKGETPETSTFEKLYAITRAAEVK